MRNFLQVDISFQFATQQVRISHFVFATIQHFHRIITIVARRCFM
jgi:hypothetical protein